MLCYLIAAEPYIDWRLNGLELAATSAHVVMAVVALALAGAGAPASDLNYVLIALLVAVVLLVLLFELWMTWRLTAPLRAWLVRWWRRVRGRGAQGDDDGSSDLHGGCGEANGGARVGRGEGLVTSATATSTARPVWLGLLERPGSTSALATVSRHGSLHGGGSPIGSSRSPIGSRGGSPARGSDSPVRGGGSPLGSASGQFCSGGSPVQGSGSPLRSASSPLGSGGGGGGSAAMLARETPAWQRTLANPCGRMDLPDSHLPPVPEPSCSSGSALLQSIVSAPLRLLRDGQSQRSVDGRSAMLRDSGCSNASVRRADSDDALPPPQPWKPLGEPTAGASRGSTGSGGAGVSASRGVGSRQLTRSAPSFDGSGHKAAAAALDSDSAFAAQRRCTVAGASSDPRQAAVAAGRGAERQPNGAADSTPQGPRRTGSDLAGRRRRLSTSWDAARFAAAAASLFAAPPRSRDPPSRMSSVGSEAAIARGGRPGIGAGGTSAAMGARSMRTRGGLGGSVGESLSGSPHRALRAAASVATGSVDGAAMAAGASAQTAASVDTGIANAAAVAAAVAVRAAAANARAPVLFNTMVSRGVASSQAGPQRQASRDLQGHAAIVGGPGSPRRALPELPSLQQLAAPEGKAGGMWAQRRQQPPQDQ
eukprot:365868-Chlamydomonas_euryale.AAC.7